MSLTILGTSVLSKDACKKLLLERNPKADATAIDDYYAHEHEWGIRADVLVCQMYHETGYMTSWWSLPPRRNPAGLGVTGETSATDPKSDAWVYDADKKIWAKGYAYPDWNTSVQHHFAHMAAYAIDADNATAKQIDPRYPAVRSMITSKKWAVAKVMTDLNGKWAVPGTTYGQTIEDVYNVIANLK